MVKPRGIDLSYEDLAGPAPDVGESEAVGGFDFGVVRAFNLEVQQTVVAFRELLQLAIAARSGNLAGQGFVAAPGAAAPAPAAGVPDPGAMRRSAAVLLGYLEAWAGDVTMLELGNRLVRQFGAKRLSDLRAALGVDDAAQRR